MTALLSLVCRVLDADDSAADTLCCLIAASLKFGTSLRQRHPLTLAMLKLCYESMARGCWSIPTLLHFVTSVVAVLAEGDSFSAVEDDEYRLGERLLFRAKLLSVAILHLMCDLTTQQSTLSMMIEFQRTSAAGISLSLRRRTAWLPPGIYCQMC